jgi:hypothetical protein
MTSGSEGSGDQVPPDGEYMPGLAASARGLAAVAADVPPPRAATGVLADRIAAALVHREPGWRLPRRSALARRYNVSMAELDVAIGELVRRSLIRRLPDGQLYRASPAEYLIPVEGVPGLATRLDPMGAEVTCRTRHVSQRDAPQDVAWALGVDSEAQVRVVRSVWATDGEPVAISTAYVPEQFAGALADDRESFEDILRTAPGSWAGEAPDGPDGACGGPGGAPGEQAAYARAVDLELSPPQPSVARSLRLVPGQSAVTVTIRFDDPASRVPVGLTVVILKPELFRVAIQAGSLVTSEGESR